MFDMRYVLLFCLFLAALGSMAQQPFENEIRDFKKYDSINPPPGDPILFVGSSSFRLWKGVQNDFPGKPILNRGFGGSTLEDVIRYQEDIIFPYAPKQIIIYCGENDIASGASSQDVLSRFDRLFTSIRSRLPDVPIAFVSMKPSPSREKYRDQLENGNRLIRDYLAKKRQATYVDVYSRMLNKHGKPKPELFVSDSLHMSQKGYAIWQKAIEPVLRR